MCLCFDTFPHSFIFFLAQPGIAKQTHGVEYGVEIMNLFGGVGVRIFWVMLSDERQKTEVVCQSAERLEVELISHGILIVPIVIRLIADADFSGILKQHTSHIFVDI